MPYDEELAFWASIEKDWGKSLPRYSHEQLPTIFPEAKRIIPNKLAEWKKELSRIRNLIRDKLIFLNHLDINASAKRFWREWIKYIEGLKLLTINAHISRLKHYLYSSNSKYLKSRISETCKQQALLTPIMSIASRFLNLRKVGRNYKGLCPFHEDKNPSFYIYPATNSFYCFGCQQGGDVIKFVMLIHSYSFKEAIQFLANEI